MNRRQKKKKAAAQKAGSFGRGHCKGKKKRSGSAPLPVSCRVIPAKKDRRAGFTA